jgi:hypothetical protein
MPNDLTEPRSESDRPPGRPATGDGAPHSSRASCFHGLRRHPTCASVAGRRRGCGWAAPSPPSPTYEPGVAAACRPAHVIFLGSSSKATAAKSSINRWSELGGPVGTYELAHACSRCVQKEGETNGHLDAFPLVILFPGESEIIGAGVPGQLHHCLDRAIYRRSIVPFRDVARACLAFLPLAIYGRQWRSKRMKTIDLEDWNQPANCSRMTSSIRVQPS